MAVKKATAAETMAKVTAMKEAEAKAAAEKKAPAKKAATKATETKAAAEKKAPAKKAAAKTTETKAAAEKKPATKPAAEKKAPAKKAATKSVQNVIIEFAGGQVNTADLVKRALETSNKKTVKELNVYYQPENGMIYFTADGEEGSFSL